MARFFVSGVAIDLPAIRLERGSTRYLQAWVFQEYATVRLLSAVEESRVHTNGRSFPGREGSVASGPRA